MSRTKVDPIQKAVLEFLDNGGSWTYICKELGWMQSDTKPDSSRLQRCLGLRRIATKGGSDSKRYEYVTKEISTENATRILRAIGAEPMDYGL